MQANAVDHKEHARCLDVNNVINPYQQRCMNHRSCLSSLLEISECWSKALDEGSGIDVLYLDFRKAFDSVLHKRLIERIEEYGITGKLLAWVQSFYHAAAMLVWYSHE